MSRRKKLSRLLREATLVDIPTTVGASFGGWNRRRKLFLELGLPMNAWADMAEVLEKDNKRLLRKIKELTEGG